MEVYDIETMKGLFLYMSYGPQTGTWLEFEVHEVVNTLDGLVRYLVGNKGEFISFNGLGFDAQVLQYIIDNNDKWYNLSNQEVIDKIYAFSQRIIDDQKYDLSLPYWEDYLENKQIDLFKIHHFDNENRRTSLKWLEFTMESPNVEEMPIHHSASELSREDIQTIKDYCRNDIENTYKFYLYTVGQAENEFYKGIDKIQDRRDLIEELQLSPRAMSWSDVKIGEEINKQTYCRLAKLRPNQLYDLKMRREPTARFTYGDCIPDYVVFKNPTFIEFYNRMKEVRVNLNEKEEYPFTYKGTNYLIAKGGIHSNEKNRIIRVQVGWILRDADIGGQYPHSIIKRGLYPAHLGGVWLVGYTWVRDRRAEYKSKSKLSKKFKGLSDQFKLAQNGGGFGKTNERTNWQYDPKVHFSCTIGNQFEILMLVEWLEDAGIHIVSANTDGVVAYFESALESTYNQICAKWEETVGNNEQGKLEFTDYSLLVQSSVNDYLAIKKDGEVKKKGDFATSFELNKNPSRRIIPIALEKYFVNGVPVEETINSHTRIYDFCIGVKASKDYHYEAIKDHKAETYNRLVRFYASPEGSRLYKVKNEDSEAEGAERSILEGGTKCQVANQIDDNKAIEEYKVDYSYYIWKAKERISALEKGSKGKNFIDPNQQSLF